jgi:hypothetical protein
MKINGKFAVAASLSALTIALSIGPAPSRAGVPLSDGVARSQFRRTVDPSERSATGTLFLRQVGGKEFAEVRVQGLNLTSIGTALDASSSFDTNTPIFLLAPLNRTNLKRGNWSRPFGPATGQAPDQFFFYVDHLAELGGTSMDIISAPATTNIENGVTNFVGGVTNIIGNVTNIVGGTIVVVGDTNLFFSAYLWAPIPTLLPDPSVLNFSAHDTLTRVPDPAPSPNAVGRVRARLNNVQGRSVLDIRASGLVAGQKYSVWMADDLGNTNFINAGEMTTDKKGHRAQYIRDTKFGDPLPQQAPDTSVLRGRALLIKDEFDDVHLLGFVP